MAMVPLSPTGSVLSRTGSAANQDPFAGQIKEITDSHMKLLYLLHKYAKAAQERGDVEGWIREVHLNVLIYEGIEKEVLDYDYAPQSMLVGTKRVYMNISQEGRDDIDDLRQYGFINGLKLATEDLTSVTAFQVSLDGMKLVKTIDQALKDEVDFFLYPPKPFPPELKLVVWDTKEERFAVKTRKGYHMWSKVTEMEDVSYVGSPYLLDCFRADIRPEPMTDNSDRAWEAARGVATVKDDVEEHIVLRSVRLLIAEWVPFGSNQIVALNTSLGSADRCPGGMFTDKVDHDPSTTEFECPTGMTTVKIHDHHMTKFINLEAEVNIPEDDDVVQIENFGIHFSKEGTVVYGMKVESIQECLGSKGLSVDYLCRVLADVHEDSSRIVDSLLSSYQRKLLGMVYLGDHLSRDKFNVIMCEQARPGPGCKKDETRGAPKEKFRAEDFKDGEEVECEVTQMIGDIESYEDLSPADILLVGRRGILLAGPNVVQHELVIKHLLMLCSLDMFLQIFFQRCFTLTDTLNRLREDINHHTKDPSSVPRIRRKLSQTSAHIIMLGEILGYLDESVIEMENPQYPKDVKGIELYHKMEIPERVVNMKERVRDLAKNVKGCKHEQENLSQMTDVINTTKLEEVFGHVEVNTKDLVAKASVHERATTTLRVIQYMLAATVAFDLVDRITALDLSVFVDMSTANVGGTPEWQRSIVTNLIYQPGMWFLVNILAAALLILVVGKYMTWLESKANGLVNVVVVVNCPIHVPTLWEYVATKEIESTDSMNEGERQLKKLEWQEPDPADWDGSAPRIGILFQDAEEVSSSDEDDETQVRDPGESAPGQGFLLEMRFELDGRASKMREKELKLRMMSELDDAGVLIQVDSSGRNLRKLKAVSDISLDMGI